MLNLLKVCIILLQNFKENCFWGSKQIHRGSAASEATNSANFNNLYYFES